MCRIVHCFLSMFQTQPTVSIAKLESLLNPGDILIEFNSAAVINAKQAIDLMQTSYPKDGKCILKVIRNGSEKSIELQLIE